MLWRKRFERQFKEAFGLPTTTTLAKERARIEPLALKVIEKTAKEAKIQSLSRGLISDKANFAETVLRDRLKEQCRLAGMYGLLQSSIHQAVRKGEAEARADGNNLGQSA